jgi:hypothetical protein
MDWMGWAVWCKEFEKNAVRPTRAGQQAAKIVIRHGGPFVGGFDHLIAMFALAWAI